MIRGKEFQPIVYAIFKDVKNYLEGEQVQVNCPRCMENEGSSYPDGKYNLEINTDKRVFRCWKCDNPKFSGSLGKLVRIYGNSVDYELYKDYAEMYGAYNPQVEDYDDDIFVSVSLPDEMIPFSKMDITNKEHIEAYSYLVLDRKMSREIILKYKLGFCTIGKYAGRIIVPSYAENGEVSYFVSRAYQSFLKQKYKNPKIDKDRIIFNEGLINWDSTVYIVEGAFDMLSVINAVPQLGKTLSRKMFFKLKEKKPNVVILLDPDAKKSAIEMYHKLNAIYGEFSDRIKWVDMVGKNDIDEIRKKFGINAVLKLLKTAKQYTFEDYLSFNELSYAKKGRFRTYTKNYR